MQSFSTYLCYFRRPKLTFHAVFVLFSVVDTELLNRSMLIFSATVTDTYSSYKLTSSQNSIKEDEDEE